MVNLAIKGHATRGKEIIKILEMMGGKNIYNLYGDESYAYYTIDSNNEIKGGVYIFGDEQLCFFTLEEFLEKFPYKIGDMVRVYDFESGVRINDMHWDGYEIQYNVFTDENEWYTAKELNEFNTPHYETKNRDTFNTPACTYVYPKTYNECCNLLYPQKDFPFHIISQPIKGHRGEILFDLQKLLICRDAYWRIYGDEVGLGESWKPDWGDFDTVKYIILNSGGRFFRTTSVDNNYILTFPTEEMRDDFYENFKDLIEACKDLL